MHEVAAGRRVRRRRAVPFLPMGIASLGVMLAVVGGLLLAAHFVVKPMLTRGEASTSSAQSAYESGHFRSAESILRRLVAANPDDLSVQRQLALVLSAEGKSTEAIETYLGIVRRDPSDHLSWYSAAMLERAAGKAALSAEHFGKALSLKKGDFAYTDELARTLMQTGDYDRAAKAWGGLLERGGLSRERRIGVLMLQAQAYQADKNYVAAKKAFEAALKLDPGNEALQAKVRSFK